jgi:hypothetical protein
MHLSADGAKTGALIGSTNYFKEGKMTPIVGKIYRQKVDSEQGYEDWEYTGITKETPNGLWYAFKNDLGVYYFDENDLKEFKEA